MKNQNITKFLKNPSKMYVQMTPKELTDFFSKGITRLAKDKCYKVYNMEDFRRGIIEANCLPKNKDVNIHIVDLMLYALAKIEDLELTVSDLEKVIAEIESENSQDAENIEETQDNT